MTRGRSFILVVVFLMIVPAVVQASCSQNGNTIVYVNGIETSEVQANNDRQALETQFKKYITSTGVKFVTGYNPSHIEGIGDLTESIAQTFHTSITNFDRDTILMQIYPEVTTQKILLVGHSQGTFYTNEIYKYLINHGVSPQSIAVYNLATPADHVEGGGTYLTSTNDKVIEYIREKDAQWNAALPLLPNIIIPREPGWQMDGWGGHYPNVYLTGAPDRIVHDIESALQKLSAGSNDTPNCFVPPTQTLGYRTQAAFFAVADPTAHVAIPVAVKTWDGSAFALSSLGDGIAGFTDVLNAAIGKAYYTFFPKPTAQNATVAFAVEKALYGSSLSAQEYQALLEDKPLPENNPPTQSDATQDPPSQPDTQTPIPPPQNIPAPATQSAPEPEPVPSTPAPQIPTPVPVTPGFGGGGSAPISTIATETQSESASTDSNATTTDPVATTTEPVATSTAPALAILAPDDGATLATTTIGFTGTTSPNATVFVLFGVTNTSAQADAAGNWSLALTLDSGTTTVSFSALDASGASSATSTRTIAVSLPHTAPAQPTLSPITQTPCSNQSLIAQGYFFSPEKDEAGYSPQGFLEDHFTLLPQYQTGRTFKLFWNFYSDTCGVEGPLYDHPSLSITLPSGDTNWSVRFTSATHFDVWDDDTNTVLNSADIPVLPAYVSIAFGATIDGNASTLASRGLKFVQSGSAPTIDSSIAAAPGCSAQNNSYLFDGDYERAEYVSGLLHLHFRLQTPYNDGRGFYYLLQAGNDCSVLSGAWWKNIPTSIAIPAYERYFSLRMASSTHWQLWDDEQNAPLGAEGDIAEASGYVRFFSVLDVNASYLSGAYAPAQ